MVTTCEAFIDCGRLHAIRKGIGIIKLNRGWIGRIESVQINGSAPVIWIRHQDCIRALNDDRNRTPGRNR